MGFISRKNLILLHVNNKGADKPGQFHQHPCYPLCILKAKLHNKEHSGSLVECLTLEKGEGVGASLCYVLEQDTFILAL